MISPYSLAFPEISYKGIDAINITINILFSIDIVVNFFNAYYDEYFTIIDDYSVSFQPLNFILLAYFYEIPHHMVFSRFNRSYSI